MKLRFALLLLLSLNGCALWQSPPVSVARPVMSHLAMFTLNGRVSVTQQDKHHSASLRWHHQQGRDEILLLTPLGQVAARIYRDGQRATLDDGKKQYQAESAEQLMMAVLGWYLPVDDLHHWVLSMPADVATDKLERNEFGQISSLQQNGWQVSYQRYQDEKADAMPTRLSLQHEDLKIQLVIDEWLWN